MINADHISAGHIVGNEYRGYNIVALILHTLQIYFQDGGSHLHRIARAHQSLEVFSFQIYRIQAHMNEHFQAVVCEKTNGVLCVKYGLYRSLYRGYEIAVFRLYGCSLSQNLLGKCRIIYF